MSSAPIHLNGVRPAPVPVPSGRIWPIMIVSFLCLNATIVAITVYFATSDKSVATEPDYYAKALGYNDTLRQRSENERLRWHISPTLRPAVGGRAMELAVMVSDRSGAAVEGATVDAVAFASVRSGDRQKLSLHGTRTAGEHIAPIRIDRPGEWCLRIAARRGSDTFTTDTTLLVPDAGSTPSPTP